MSRMGLMPFVNHLWQSTLFAASIWLLVLMMRKNGSAVRHRLWLAASVKFLIPFSVLVSIGSRFQWRTIVLSESAGAFTAPDRLVAAGCNRATVARWRHGNHFGVDRRSRSEYRLVVHPLESSTPLVAGSNTSESGPSSSGNGPA